MSRFFDPESGTFWNEPALPATEKINDDWIADLEWIHCNADQKPRSCIVMSVRYVGRSPEKFRECPQHVKDRAEKLGKIVYDRFFPKDDQS